MGLGGIQGWQLVIILIVFLVTLIATVPFRQAVDKKPEARTPDAEHRDEDGSKVKKMDSLRGNDE